MASPRQRPLECGAGCIDEQAYPHLVQRVFDYTVSAARSGDRTLLTWRLVSRHWSECAGRELFRHIVIGGGGRAPCGLSSARLRRTPRTHRSHRGP